MFKLLDRIMPILFAACIAFILVSAGIIAGHFKWGPTVAYQNFLADIDKMMAPKAEKKKAAKLSNAVTINNTPDKTFAGFTLITKDDDTIVLLDMDGKSVHKWTMPFSKVWPPEKNDDRFKTKPFFAYARMLSDGSIIATYHTVGNPVYGLGMIKMDANSNIIWSYGENVHDGFDVGSDGKVYALLQTPTHGKDVPEVDYARAPAMIDSIAILSADGVEKKRIDLFQAFSHSKYDQMLYSVGNSMRYAYTNSIMVLNKDMAAHFPMFKEGDLLVAIANMDTIAVIRPSTALVVWANNGLWRRPFDARFTENGTISLYDSQGYYDGNPVQQGRVLRFNPATQGVEWFYNETDRLEKSDTMSGMQQMLPNANMMVLESDTGIISELTPDKIQVWKFTYPGRINSAQRIGYKDIDKRFWVGSTDEK